MINETLIVVSWWLKFLTLITISNYSQNCGTDSEACSKYECNLPRFPSRYKSVSLDLTLAFHPRRISSQLKYEHFAFTIKSYLSTSDLLIGDTLVAVSQTEFRFEKQSTLLKSKASPLIMFGGAGVALLLLLITTIVLIKRGFFRRKKREEMLRMKQRISMNPYMFNNVNIETWSTLYFVKLTIQFIKISSPYHLGYCTDKLVRDSHRFQRLSYIFGTKKKISRR